MGKEQTMLLILLLFAILWWPVDESTADYAYEGDRRTLGWVAQNKKLSLALIVLFSLGACFVEMYNANEALSAFVTGQKSVWILVILLDMFGLIVLLLYALNNAIKKINQLISNS